MEDYLKFEDYISERYNVSGLIAYARLKSDEHIPNDKLKHSRFVKYSKNEKIKTWNNSINIPNEINGKPVIAVKECFNIPGIESVFLGKNVLEIFDDCFYGCKDLKHIFLNDGLKYIGSNVFSGSSNNKYLNILPDSLEYIGDEAFVGFNPQAVFQTASNECLKELPSWAKLNHLPKNLKYIGKNAFIGYDWFSDIIHLNLPKNLEFWNDESIPNDNNIKTVTINKNLKHIGKYAFAHWNNLEEIFIPKTVRTIGEGAFYGCENLKRVVFEDGSLITNLQSGIFCDCSNLEDIKFPDNAYIEYIGYMAFSRCKNLKSIVLPNTVEKIGKGIFEDCFNLEHIKLPDNIKEIPNNAFYFCESLKEIDIPESVNKIGEYVFHCCKSLKELRIPKAVEYYQLNAIPEQFKIPHYFKLKD